MSALLSWLTFVLSGLLVLGLGWLKTSVPVYQQLTLVLALISVGLFSQLLIRRSKPMPRWLDFLVKYGLLFTTAAATQLLVVSSGGFSSPLLILYYIYFLGLSFLVSISLAAGFAVLALGSLGLDSYFFAGQTSIISTDPGTFLLYASSFLVIFPLANFIANKYHLKGELSKLLTGQVQLDQSIISNLNELVVVTDPGLKVVSVNESLRKILGLDEAAAIGKSLFDIINLRDFEGHPASVELLSVDRVIVEKSTRIINDLLLYVPSRHEPFKVSVSIQPVINETGLIEKLTLVINLGPSSSPDTKLTNQDLELARTAEKQRFLKLKTDLEGLNLRNLSAEVELLKKIDQDIELAKELEDFPIQLNRNLVDVAYFVKQATEARNSLATSLGVKLDFQLRSPDSAKELAMISLYQRGKEDGFAVSEYTAPVDVHWFGELIDHLIDLGLLLSIPDAGIVGTEMELLPDKSIEVAIKLQMSHYNAELDQGIFSKYYPKLRDRASLIRGSGLEGYIVKSISTQLNIPLQVKLDPSGLVEFRIIISRASH